MPRFRRKHVTRILGIYGHGAPRTLVETGTYRGETLDEIASMFARVHTIELSEAWHRHAIEHFRDRPHVVCHEGDSVETLKRLASLLTEPAVFFLDAHYSGGTTALGSDEVPLLGELHVLAKRPQRDIIIIDDARLIGTRGQTGRPDSTVYPPMEYDWSGVSQIAIRAAFANHGRIFWKEWEDRIFIITNGSLLTHWMSRGRSLWLSVRAMLSEWKHRLTS